MGVQAQIFERVHIREVSQSMAGDVHMAAISPNVRYAFTTTDVRRSSCESENTQDKTKIKGNKGI